jgi:hypothetical protein
VVQEAGFEPRILPVQQAQFFQTLEQAAIDEDPLAAGFQKVAAAGNRPGGSVEGKFHDFIPPG